jgi:UDP-glucose:(heptosyl)LPS alpha-1,3-glucosyltransferase
VSTGVASELVHWFPSARRTIRTISNGVDADRFRPDPSARCAVRTQLGLGADEPLVLFVGGDWQRKGLQLAVDAVALAPGWVLAVAGDGDPSALIARAEALGCADRIRFLGRMRDTARLYAAADAFVLPTTYETFSLVSFEAAAAGLPLLVTRVNGVEDLLEPGRNGWFIEREARDIARRLNDLSANPELALRMGADARAAALSHSWGAMGEAYMALYAELTNHA